MKLTLLALTIVELGYGQARVGQCLESPAATAHVETTRPGPILTRTGPPGFAAKPEKSRVSAPPALPQIQYPKPPTNPAASCWCGTVPASSLISETSTQEVPLISLAGNFRFDHLLLQEAKQFASAIVSGLVVSAGLPNEGVDLIQNFALMSADAAQNTVLERPDPPTLTGSYNLVLKFSGTSALAIAGSSNFTAGSVNWEVCGYQIH
jgi:hypothetical protein